MLKHITLFIVLFFNDSESPRKDTSFEIKYRESDLYHLELGVPVIIFTVINMAAEISRTPEGEGIYRVPHQTGDDEICLKALKMNQEGEMPCDAKSLSGVLKRFLRDNIELVNTETLELLLKCYDDKTFNRIIESLDLNKKVMLTFLMRLFREFMSHESVNKMNVKAVVVCANPLILDPRFLSPKNQYLSRYTKNVEFYTIMKEVVFWDLLSKSDKFYSIPLIHDIVSRIILHLYVPNMVLYRKDRFSITLKVKPFIESCSRIAALPRSARKSSEQHRLQIDYEKLIKQLNQKFKKMNTLSTKFIKEFNITVLFSHEDSENKLVRPVMNDLLIQNPSKSNSGIISKYRSVPLPTHHADYSSSRDMSTLRKSVLKLVRTTSLENPINTHMLGSIRPVKDRDVSDVQAGDEQIKSQELHNPQGINPLPGPSSKSGKSMPPPVQPKRSEKSISLPVPIQRSGKSISPPVPPKATMESRAPNLPHILNLESSIAPVLPPASKESMIPPRVSKNPNPHEAQQKASGIPNELPQKFVHDATSGHSSGKASLSHPLSTYGDGISQDALKNYRYLMGSLSHKIQEVNMNEEKNIRMPPSHSTKTGKGTMVNNDPVLVQGNAR